MRPLNFFLLFVLSALAFAPPPAVKITELLEKAESYHEKAVKTAGRVEAFQQRVSKKGNAYFVFKLTEKESTVNVFGIGTLEKVPKKGDLVEVTGTFRNQKKVGDTVYKNEIETDAKSVKPAKAD